MKTIFCCLLLGALFVETYAQPASRQNAHSIEPGTKGNQVELTIANQSSLANAAGLEVLLVRCPACLTFTSKVQIIGTLAPTKELPLLFSFDVARTAPPNKCDTVEFSIRNGSGMVWTKSVVVKYTGPTTFALDQNFPNPFNPVTTIQYQLRTDSKLTLKVYDVLGREVATLVNEEKPAGYFDVRWDAMNVASGVYFYRIEARPLAGGSGFQQIKKLMVLK